mmetsp:Transcript_10554/g.33740  ORF Transcript_10554/g.33740 Transcript_10554/m.33740 type:complete len:148 (+) Transcript_10554:70-513(+)
MGSVSHARQVPEGLECMITLEDIDETNYCEYQTAPSLLWFPAKAASAAIEELRRTQFKQFMERLETTDCEAEMRRLQEKGPPIYVEDKNVLPLPEGETHVSRLWYLADDAEISAKLEGALEGDDHQRLWDELKEVHAATQASQPNPT